MQSTFGNAEAADPRRATAVQVSFEVFPVDGSNIQVEPQSSTNVNVRAGVEYNRFVIHALSGLGVSKQDIRAKLAAWMHRLTWDFPSAARQHPSKCHELSGKFHLIYPYRVQGYKRNNMTDEFMLLGMPNPAYPPWRSSLTYVNQACGGAVDAAPFINKVSDVSNEIGFEIHNFGLIKDGFGLGVQR
ncbi:unnamed protein product [Symbiodinium microadriaticum]|nr:unnamed protein product [Symbiodinium microadriaticum]